MFLMASQQMMSGNRTVTRQQKTMSHAITSPAHGGSVFYGGAEIRATNPTLTQDGERNRRIY